MNFRTQFKSKKIVQPSASAGYVSISQSNGRKVLPTNSKDFRMFAKLDHLISSYLEVLITGSTLNILTETSEHMQWLGKSNPILVCLPEQPRKRKGRTYRCRIRIILDRNVEKVYLQDAGSNKIVDWSNHVIMHKLLHNHSSLTRRTQKISWIQPVPEDILCGGICRMTRLWLLAQLQGRRLHTFLKLCRAARKESNKCGRL